MPRVAIHKKTPAGLQAPKKTAHAIAPAVKHARFGVTSAPSADTAPPPIRLTGVPANQHGGAVVHGQLEGLSHPINLSSLAISSPHDPAEREARSTAGKVVRTDVHPNSVAYVNTGTGGVFRLLKSPENNEPSEIKPRSLTVARSALTVPLVERRPVAATIHRQAETRHEPHAANAAAGIKSSMSGGEPLPIGVRRFMEPRFGADFSNIRIHKSGKAAALNKQLSARAFTTQNHVFFGQDKFKPETDEGKELIAHELTHTIQQGAAAQERPEVHRSEDVNIAARTAPQVQREEEEGDAGTVLNWFAREANLIPGFRMFTIVLGVNPINMSPVARTAANILRALIELLPMGGLITQALDSSGIFEKAGAFVEQQLASLAMTGSAIKQAIMDFIDGFSLFDLLSPGKLWEKAKRIFTDPIDQIINFAIGLVSGIVELVKDAILRPIAKLAEGTDGYALLKAVMGKDPITGDPYPQTAENIIGPFLKLIGQDEIWENMKKSGAIGKAFAWFKGALGELMGFVNEIPGLFIAAFKSLELADIILVPLAFGKLVKVFGDFVGRFTSWVGDKIWKLLEIIFDVVKPGAFEYVKKTGAALKSILQNPMPFLGNLVKAAKLGFQNFASNFGTHLKAGLLDWLTGSLPGVYIPKAFTLLEVGKFALSVLGITWGQIRAKIVKALGPNGEKIMAGLEFVFNVIVALVKGGPAAAWDVIKDKLTSLKDQVIEGIKDLVIDAVVTKGIPKLVGMFIPGAGFIPAIISIYDTIMVFVNKIKKIIQVVTAFIDSIVAIAGGAIGAAASRVESVLAGLLALAINFIAGFAGLGKVADKVMGVIQKVRASVDKAIDAAITWIVAKAKSLFKSLFGKKEDDKRTDAEKLVALNAGVQEGEALLKDPKQTSKQISGKLQSIKKKHKLTVLTLVKRSEAKTSEVDYIHGEVNPPKDSGDVTKPKPVKDQVAPVGIGTELQVENAGNWYGGAVEKFDDDMQLVWCTLKGAKITKRGFAVGQFIASYVDGGNTVVRKPPAVEAYDREKHYGHTPTEGDRTHFGAGPDDVVDHNPPLVKRYYDGDPMYGGKPGKDMSPAERIASGKNRAMMALQPKAESHAQGGEMSGYSKEQKKKHGL